MGKIKYLPLILILISCGSVDCPSFPEEGLVWMPYKQDENINFSDGTDTFQLNVYETFRSSAYSFAKGPLGQNVCEASAHAKLSGNSLLPQFQIFGFNAELPRSYTINFVDSINFNFVLNAHGLVPYNRSGITCEYLIEYDNGFKTYYDVAKLEYDTLLYPETQINQVFIAKNIGIIQFEDQFNHKTWGLVANETDFNNMFPFAEIVARYLPASQTGRGFLLK